MTTDSIVLGIDGGGTKTVAVVMDANGTVRGRAQVGSTNWNSVGVETARHNLQTAIAAALANAEIADAQVRAVSVCAAGVDRAEDRARMTDWAQSMLPDATVAVDNDAVAALASGTNGELYGVVLISGTGMIVCGFDRQGRRGRAGGWGALLGDPGSGYALAMDALAAVTWAADGRGPQTGLTARILDHLDLPAPEALIGWAYKDYAWERFAQLAPLVVACAEEGDAVAQQILDRGAAGLARAVEAVVHRLHLQQASFPLVLAGGVLRRGPYAGRVKERLRTIVPKAQFIHPDREPAEGAALLALRLENE